MRERLIAQNTNHLRSIIFGEIKLNGHECDLNHIDISNLKDLSSLFYLSNFNGDISKWDVSNINKMEGMFELSNFNKDISKWNVSNVTTMSEMFLAAAFNQDISNWNVSKVENMASMFSGSKFNNELNNWEPINLKYKNATFDRCPAPKPYWSEDGDIDILIKNYRINNLKKQLESSLLNKSNKNIKMKI